MERLEYRRFHSGAQACRIWGQCEGRRQPKFVDLFLLAIGLQATRRSMIWSISPIIDVRTKGPDLMNDLIARIQGYEISRNAIEFQAYTTSSWSTKQDTHVGLNTSLIEIMTRWCCWSVLYYQGARRMALRSEKPPWTLIAALLLQTAVSSVLKTSNPFFYCYERNLNSKAPFEVLHGTKGKGKGRIKDTHVKWKGEHSKSRLNLSEPGWVLDTPIVDLLEYLDSLPKEPSTLQIVVFNGYTTWTLRSLC